MQAEVADALVVTGAMRRMVLWVSFPCVFALLYVLLLLLLLHRHRLLWLQTTCIMSQLMLLQSHTWLRGRLQRCL